MRPPDGSCAGGVPVSILSLSLSWKLEGRIRLAVPLSCRVRRSYAFHVPVFATVGVQPFAAPLRVDFHDRRSASAV